MAPTSATTKVIATDSDREYEEFYAGYDRRKGPKLPRKRDVEEVEIEEIVLEDVPTRTAPWYKTVLLVLGALIGFAAWYVIFNPIFFAQANDNRGVGWGTFFATVSFIVFVFLIGLGLGGVIYAIIRIIIDRNHPDDDTDTEQVHVEKSTTTSSA